MNDKEMIEEIEIREMARVFMTASCMGSECENCLFIKSVNEAEECCVCLKALYNAGYRKLPEDSVINTPTVQTYSTHDNDLVVLSREEYEKLKDDNKYLREIIDKFRKDNTDIRKETAEKFAKELKARFRKQEERFATDVTRFETDLDKVRESDLPTAKYVIGKATGQATMAEKAQYYIDELTKQFGVEIKE